LSTLPVAKTKTSPSPAEQYDSVMWFTSHVFEKKKKTKIKEEDISEEFRQLSWSNQDLQVPKVRKKG
jgi:hypothetical protein